MATNAAMVTYHTALRYWQLFGLANLLMSESESHSSFWLAKHVLKQDIHLGNTALLYTEKEYSAESDDAGPSRPQAAEYFIRIIQLR
jgi:hypothetical protein